MHIKKGDKVIIIAGKDNGKTGTVVRALPRKEQVIIEGLNTVKKHQRPTRANSKGQIVEKSAPIHVSNVMLIDPKTNKRTRVSAKKIDGTYMRIAKKSGTKIG